MIPVITLVGNAGVGKDTVGKMLTEVSNGQTIAFADPLKRIAKNIFGFSDEQLWGPSHKRNEIEPRFSDKETAKEAWYQINRNIFQKPLFQEIAEVFKHENLAAAINSLRNDIFVKLTNEPVLTPRIALQTLGTEWGRSVHPDIWVNYAKDVIKKMLIGGYKYSQTDGLVRTDSRDYSPFIIITDARFRNEVVNMALLGSKVWKIESRNDVVKSTHQSETELSDISASLFDAIIHNSKEMGLNLLKDRVQNIYNEQFVYTKK
jgi:hypothetical protein